MLLKSIYDIYHFMLIAFCYIGTALFLNCQYLAKHQDTLLLNCKTQIWACWMVLSQNEYT